MGIEGFLEAFLEKLRKNPDIAEKYAVYFRGQEEKVLIEWVTEGNSDGPIHYVPHSAVITPSAKQQNFELLMTLKQINKH